MALSRIGKMKAAMRDRMASMSRPEAAATPARSEAAATPARSEAAATPTREAVSDMGGRSSGGGFQRLKQRVAARKGSSGTLSRFKRRTNRES